MRIVAGRYACTLPRGWLHATAWADRLCQGGGGTTTFSSERGDSARLTAFSSDDTTSSFSSPSERIRRELGIRAARKLDDEMCYRVSLTSDRLLVEIIIIFHRYFPARCSLPSVKRLLVV